MVPNKNTILTDLNNFLNKISHWDFQWKKEFNLNPNKEASEVILMHKSYRIAHKSLTFNNCPVQKKLHVKSI